MHGIMQLVKYLRKAEVCVPSFTPILKRKYAKIGCRVEELREPPN